MIVTTAPSLKILLEDLIDYAGLFPPAKVELSQALKNYEKYSQESHSWMLRWFVVMADNLDNVPKEFDGKLSIIAGTDQPRAATIESKKVIENAKVPVYCEVDPKEFDTLNKVKESGNFGKIRCGGVKPDMIPSTEAVAGFIHKCASLELPFKATAGLHHPLRKEQALTYASDAERAKMHGFINVLFAAALAWQGKELEVICSVMDEEDSKNFSFNDDNAAWKEHKIDLADLKKVRAEFFHSIGSCSFDEPIQDLKELKLL